MDLNYCTVLEAVVFSQRNGALDKAVGNCDEGLLGDSESILPGSQHAGDASALDESSQSPPDQEVPDFATIDDTTGGGQTASAEEIRDMPAAEILETRNYEHQHVDADAQMEPQTSESMLVPHENTTLGSSSSLFVKKVGKGERPVNH